MLSKSRIRHRLQRLGARLRDQVRRQLFASATPPRMQTRRPSLEQLETRALLTLYTATDVPAAIADNGAATQSTITIPDSGLIGDLNVRLDITHANVEDLTVALWSPDGTEVPLFAHVGGTGADFADTVLDDEAATSITTGSAPFSDSYQPQSLLGAFDLTEVQGTWTLVVQDDSPGVTGTLNSWTIDVHAGADPKLSIPKDIEASPDDNINVPVNIDSIEDLTGNELFAADLVVFFNPNVVTVNSVALGTVPANSPSAQWGTPAVVIDNTLGRVRIGVWNNVGLGGTFIGSLVTINVTVKAAASSGVYPINLVASSGMDQTLLNEGELILNPAPTDDADDEVDGLMTILGPDTSPPTLDITRQNPTAETTNADSVTFLVDFNEDVANVDKTDFAFTLPTGLTIVDYAVNDGGDADASTYNVVVSGIAGDGELKLEFSSTQDIKDLADNAFDPDTGITSEEAYLIDNTPPVVTVVRQTTTNTTPTITGTVSDGTLQVVVNTKTYTVGDGNLSLDGTAWSLTIPAGNSLTVGKYDVAASATDAVGNTGSDSTINELAVAPSVVINEVDSDTPGNDVLEFVELYDGGAGKTSLTGLVLVLFNGEGDVSYRAIDLDGKSTDSNGFFLIGNPGVPNVDLTFPDGTLQNGADAVALYLADGADFPAGTLVTGTFLIDALVYDTDDAVDPELIAALTPGQNQINEAGGGDAAIHSNSRRPDGGPRLVTSTYVQQAPTPGTTNMNLPPLAVADSYETAEDVLLTVATPGVLSNDTDDENDTLTAVKVTDPTHGTLTLNADGSFTYDPADNFNGTDSFTYKANDGTSDSNIVQVNITVTAVNDAPGIYIYMEQPELWVMHEDTTGDLHYGALQFWDVDAGSELVRTTMTATHGTVTLASVQGLDFDEGDGTDDAFMVFTSTIADLNHATAYMDGEDEVVSHFYLTPDFYGEATLTITINDLGHTPAPAEETTGIVTIPVTSVNDAPAGTNNTVTMDEDTVYAFAAGDFGFTDPKDTPANAFNRVKLTSLATAGTLELNGTAVGTGDFIPVASIPDLTFTPADDANGSPYATLEFQVEDNGGTERNGVNLDATPNTITITVTPVNDPPVITSNGGGDTAAVSLSENTTAVTTVLATDADGTTPTYAIAGGADAAKFTINATSGVLTFQTAPDFENPTDQGETAGNNTYVVEVQATDGTNQDLQTITVTVTDVNEFAPVLDDATFSVAEDAANGTAVGTVTATDADATKTFTYSITAGNSSGAFAIGGATGAITVANGSQLDFETTPQFVLTVQVSDGGPGAARTDTATVTIDLTDVNEHDPVLYDATFSMAENAANGTAVGTVTATDGDSTKTFTYSIMAGNGSGAFSIDGAMGAITVADGSQLNFETTPQFVLTVQISDGGPGAARTDTAMVTINLTDVNEHDPVLDDATCSVAENAANGTAVGTVTATDADATKTFTYSITAGNSSGAFAIDASTGAITVADGSQLNFETTTQFALTVQVSDGGPGAARTDTATVTIDLTDVNEYDPVLDDATFSVAENTANGTTVGTVTATDADATKTFTYSIMAGNGSGAFAIDASTGEITVADGSQLDYETTPQFVLTVQVSDGAPGAARTDTATVTIDLTDVNEYDPVLYDATFSIAENAANGTAVGTVTATDGDSTKSFTYSITAGNSSGAFAIDGATGAITVADGSQLDDETTPQFVLTVQISDGGPGAARTDTATVTIVVTAAGADTLAPTVTIDQAADQADPSIGDTPIRFTVVFSEPVTGFGPEDVVLFGTAPGDLAAAVTGSGTTYTVTVSGMTGNGTVRALVARCAAMDAAGNQSGPSFSTDNTIHVQFDDPEIAAKDDSYTTEEDTQLVIPAPGVLDNDVPSGDGTLTAQLLTTASNGYLVFNSATGSFSYRPFDNYFGEDTFTYLAVSGTAISAPATVTITVTPVNDPPVARDDKYTVEQDAALNVSGLGGLLANDTDVDNERTQLTAIKLTDPAHGTLSVNADGSLNYVPNEGYSGSDSFTYKVNDGEADSNAATVTIEVTAPQATPVVESVVINDGAAQRSMVNSLTVTFTSLVPLQASHFKLINKDTQAEVGLQFETSNVTGKSVVTLKFAGAGIVGGSLADGNYLLTIDLEQNEFGTGDDYQFGAAEADKFFRFFGDSDGDRDVDNMDFFRIRGTLNQTSSSPTYLEFFDFDLDGDVDAADMAQFQTRYGKKLAWTP